MFRSKFRVVSTVVLVVVLALQSCSAYRYGHEIKQEYLAPEPITVENSAEFQEGSFDRVWESVIAFFASEQISIDTVEKDSGIIVARKLLTATSVGDGLADLGQVRTRRVVRKQWLKPSGFAGSLNPSYVEATGTVTKEEDLAETAVEDVRSAFYKATVAFNVFVERFADNRVRMVVNVNLEAAEVLPLWSGWYWRPGLSSSTPGTESQIAGGLGAIGVTPALVDGEPVSTGRLEAALLNFVASRVGT